MRALKSRDWVSRDCLRKIEKNMSKKARKKKHGKKHKEKTTRKIANNSDLKDLSYLYIVFLGARS